MNLDQFQSLERVGSTIYIGFNDGVERVVFPKLVEVDGAIVIEANARVRELVFPALIKVGRYVHVHDNATLEKFEAPKLEHVGGVLSIVDNPRLQAVVVATAAKPAQTDGLEVARNGAKAAWPTLFITVKPAKSGK